MIDEEIKKLEDRVNTLLGVCRHLKDENQKLRTREQDLSEQNVRLSQRTQLARTRIEAIIGKLQSMDVN